MSKKLEEAMLEELIKETELESVSEPTSKSILEPKEIKVLHRTYYLYEPEDWEDDPILYEIDAQAYCDFNGRKIVIPKRMNGETLTKEYRQDLLRHEIIHALLEVSGKDEESRDEVLVELIRFLSGWLEANSEVFKCLD